MDITAALTTLGTIIAILLGVYNSYNSKRLGDSTIQSGQSGTIKTLNESVELANKRALAAEERANSLEEVYDKRAWIAEQKAEELESRLSVLESALSYRITFDVTLGTKPKVEHVEIEHYPERRHEARKVEPDRRKQ